MGILRFSLSSLLAYLIMLRAFSALQFTPLKNRFGTEINSIGTIVSGFSGSRSMLLIKVIEKVYPLEKPKSEKYQVRI